MGDRKVLSLAQLILDGIEKMRGQKLGSSKSLSPIMKGLKGQKRSMFSLVSYLGRDQRTKILKTQEGWLIVENWGQGSQQESQGFQL